MSKSTLKSIIESKGFFMLILATRFRNVLGTQLESDAS